MTEAQAAQAKKFGYFGGVFTPSVLTILGVIMYLRFGWVVGQAGLIGTLLIVLIAHIISIATGLSVSSIATNRVVKTGGAYYMISRSLGAPTGAAIGIPLFFAQAISVTFYIVGFTESLALLYPNINAKIIGSITLFILTLISIKSADLAIRTQYLIMGAIFLSLVSFFAGTGAGTAPVSGKIVWWNSQGASFSYVFAVFFPAVTGIMAGVSMSGDLQDPRKALPKGTMLAIFVGMIIYLAMPLWFSLHASQTALLKDNNIVWKISRWPMLIYVGVWGATLSSAVGSIMAAPRTLQALAMDNLAPKVFAKGTGPSSEPRNGILLTFVLAEIGILLGSLDLIAPILTMFFLATYGATNLACGLERWADSPSFRPTFRVPAWVSISGAISCFYVMSIINMGAMIASLLICAFIYIYADRKLRETRWGDARHGIWAAMLKSALVRLHHTAYHPMNWRPNLLILGGSPEKRQYLLDLGHAIGQNQGIVSYFHLISGDISQHAKRRNEWAKMIENRWQEEYPNVFYRVDVVDDIYRGAVSVAQSYGIGQFEANTVMLGWPHLAEKPAEFAKMICDLHLLGRSVLLVDYKEEKKFGEQKTIHIWWGGLRGNGSKILLLAYLLQSDARWQGAHVTLFMAVDKADASERVHADLQRIVAEARLQADVRVILRDQRPIAETMSEHSSQADLAIMGFRLPDYAEGKEEQEANEFFERYKLFLQHLPTTLLVCSAQDFEGEPVLFDS
ncbi:MAG: Na-K-Cl cotransporter [Myxococcales bacterium]|nr:Na-K-Cl cotransporter [Myxococcales bacterium]MCB9642657.1 Na-K-Cl cotransporter [Myxococcales bacterium]